VAGSRIHALLVIVAAGLALGMSTASAATEVYRVVDSEGRVTYTDSPAPDTPSEPVELPPLNTREPVELPVEAEPLESEESAAVPYTRSRIVQPKQDQTIPPGQLDLVVQLELEPRLQTGHLVKLFHNGKPVGDPLSGTSFVLTDLIRGQHQVWAEVVDAQGKRRAKSDPVTFHVKRYRPRK